MTPILARPRLAALWRGRTGTALRLGFAVLPLVWLFSRFRPDDVASRVRLMGWDAFALALPCVFVSSAIAAVRWQRLLVAYGASPAPTVAALFRDTLTGAYFALLPSGLVGDVVRGYRTRHHVASLTTSFTVIAIERLCGLAGLLVIALVALTVGPRITASAFVESAFVVGVVATLAATTIALVLPYAGSRNPRLRALVERTPLLRRINPPRSVGPVLQAAALSLLTQGAAVVAVWLLARPLTPAATLVAMGTVVPPILLLSYIPVAPAAVGQREALFTAFFGAIGIEPATAIAVSIAFLACLLVQAGTGGVVYFVGSMRRN